MDKNAVERARVEFDRAIQSMADLAATEHFAEIERHWSAFLIAADRVYSKLWAGSNFPACSYAWWGQKLHERRADPLLSYVWHARNSDEHGLRKVTAKYEGAFNLVPPTPQQPIGELQIVYPTHPARGRD